MKYYIVKYETNNKIVGVGTQIQNCDPFGPSPYFDVPLNGPIDFGIEFPTFFMEDRAKRIDFVNCAQLSYKFLVFSPRAFEILKKINSDAYQSYAIKVIHKEMELEYIAIHISFERQNEFIDWEKSEFGLVNQKNGFLPNGDWSYIENLRFTNWDEFNRSFQSYLTTEFNVRIKKIVYVNDLPYDLFRLGNPVVKHFCSEKFKSEVEKGELTGFSFEELSS